MSATIVWPYTVLLPETATGADWVEVRLTRDPLTRHLKVRVSLDDRTLILEGRVPTWLDRQNVYQVAHRAYAGGRIDNRIEVVPDDSGFSGTPLFWGAQRQMFRPQMAVA